MTRRAADRNILSMVGRSTVDLTGVDLIRAVEAHFTNPLIRVERSFQTLITKRAEMVKAHLPVAGPMTALVSIMLRRMMAVPGLTTVAGAVDSTAVGVGISLSVSA
jgi:hypothetical protein